MRSVRPQPSSAISFFSMRDRTIPLVLILITLIGAFGNVQIVPRFTNLPPTVSYYIGHGSTGENPDPISLHCRAWPPNAKLFLLAAELALSEASQTASVGSTTRLLPLPQGLGDQRYGLLPASQIPRPNDWVSGEARELIRHESLADAIRARPGAAPNDEVAVQLIVSSLSELRQLESVRVHCLVATAFGRLLSSPFRLIPTSLGTFPDVVTHQETQIIKLWINNIAVVDCQLPIDSVPRPLVHFVLNGTQISEEALQNDKYRLVWRPDDRQVSLLIDKFKASDCGIYQCVITNPLTGEHRYAPKATQLELITPDSPVRTRIAVPLVSSSPTEANNGAATSPAGSQKVVVEEGQNITLFCVIHGAPPPIVVTYPFNQNLTDPVRFQRDRKFGLLKITNVQLKDAGFYVCSDRQISSTTQLHVKPRLRLVTKPVDLHLSKLGRQAQFKCSSSDPQVTPYWLFNGRPKTTTSIVERNENTLTLTNVTKDDLGVYQCIAQRQSTTRVGTDEWVSASAILALDSDKTIRTPEELALFTPHKPEPSVEKIPEITTSELTPQAQVLYDNLAVYLLWESFHPELSGLDQSTGVEYRVEYSVQTGPLEEDVNGELELVRNSTNHGGQPTVPALVGLMGHEAVRWSEPETLKQQTVQNSVYVTESILKPSKRYRFRVLAVNPSTGVSLVPPSDWSPVVSMEHISPIDPPQIQVIRPLSEGRIHLRWTFRGSDQTPSTNGPHSQSRQFTRDNLGVLAGAQSSGDSYSSSTDPLLFDADENAFQADYFLALARPLVKPKSHVADSFKYGMYWATQVNGSAAREALLSGLNQSASYQVVVYGVRTRGDKRQITRFSKAVFVNMATANHTGEYSLFKALTSNWLMYIILVAIAALAFLVFIAILVCVCRQQRYGQTPGMRKKQQNGMIHANNFKDPNQYVSVSSTDGSRQPGVPGQGPGTGGMMMNNLQLSAFSDQSAATSQAHQQAAFVRPGPPQSVDQYAAALSKEMMQQQQQQQQSVLGSQMHLYSPQQQQQAAQLQHMYHPQHHQSHHSLLLPSAAAYGQSNPAFPSGTLPGGPRYMRQQHPGYASQVQFGSQQPLNRTTTPANFGGEYPAEYYHAQQSLPPGVYAHQQPQLPPVPHPQTAELPPPHGIITNEAGHRQMVYYPGPMTPNGASLKREAPTGSGMVGPMQDNSAYGTLLQRGQLTGSMIHDPHAMHGGAMSPVNHPAAASSPYYPHGSQQALHMITYPNGMASPQQQVYSPQAQQQQAVYFAQQQQQQQGAQAPYAGFYGQQLSQQPGPHGYGPTDGESIYSYFSQQANLHQPLNPLPEEHQQPNGPGGYVDSGMQTTAAELNGAAEGSPSAGGGGGSHRHHRRRRRKQQQQNQQPLLGRQAMDEASENLTNDSGDAAGGGDGMGEPTMADQSGVDSRGDEQQRSVFDPNLSNPKRHHSLSGAGTYSDAEPANMSGGQQQSFTSPQSYHQAEANSMEANRSGHMRFDSPHRGVMPPASPNGHLPPPNQPPPPPPAIALSGLSQPGLHNGIDPHGAMMQPPLTADSIPRRAHPTGAAGGLAVGPPPRIRDYSEYGIPRGIGLPPTPNAGQQQQQQPAPPPYNSLMNNPAALAQQQQQQNGHQVHHPHHHHHQMNGTMAYDAGR